MGMVTAAGCFTFIPRVLRKEKGTSGGKKLARVSSSFCFLVNCEAVFGFTQYFRLDIILTDHQGFSAVADIVRD